MKRRLTLALCALLLSAAPVGASTLSRDAGGVRTPPICRDGLRRPCATPPATAKPKPRTTSTPAPVPTPRRTPPACGPQFCLVTPPGPLTPATDPIGATPAPLPDRRP